MSLINQSSVFGVMFAPVAPIAVLATVLVGGPTAQAGAKTRPHGDQPKTYLRSKVPKKPTFPKEQWPEQEQDVINGNDRFWGRESSRDYSRRLTQETISVYPEIVYETCIKKFNEDSEAYVDELRDAFAPVRRLQNRTVLELKKEMDRLKTGNDLKPLIPKFIDWIADTSECLFNLKNFESIVAVLSVPSYEAEYWAPSGSFNRKSLGGQDVNFQFFFFNFMNLFNTEEMEELNLQYGVLFISGAANLSKQFEYLSSRDFTDLSFSKQKLINTVCARIERNVIREYSEKFMFTGPPWLPAKALKAQPPVSLEELTSG